MRFFSKGLRQSRSVLIPLREGDPTFGTSLSKTLSAMVLTSKRRGTIRACAVALLFLFSLLPALAYAAAPTEDRPVAVLRVLDKITARVEEIEVPIERPYKFGTIIITAHACRVTPPEETPESAAFLDVSELKPGSTEATVFKGWMFASSPALSAMEHPVYDLWVIGCKSEATKSSQ